MVLVEYGPYINCGRWKHDTWRVEEVVSELTRMGWAVFLKHIAQERSSERHGFVALKTLDGGKLIAESTNLQHSKHIHNRWQLAKELVKHAGHPRGKSVDAKGYDTEEEDGCISDVEE